MSLYRVWPDGTCQNIDEHQYDHMSDDFEIIAADSEEEAIAAALDPNRFTL